MKLPTEGELIEVENTVLRYYRQKVDDQNGLFTIYDRVVGTLETLIALARDPSELLRTIPDDDALDRAANLLDRRFQVANEAERRRTAPKPSMVVQPKKKRTPRRKINTHR